MGCLLYRGIHVDLTVYIFAHLRTSLRTEENLLGIYWIQAAEELVKLNAWLTTIFLGGKSAYELIHSLQNFDFLNPPCSPWVFYSSVVRASNRYLEGHGFGSRWRLRKFFFWVFRLENASSLFTRNSLFEIFSSRISDWCRFAVIFILTCGIAVITTFKSRFTVKKECLRWWHSLERSASGCLLMTSNGSTLTKCPPPKGAGLLLGEIFKDTPIVP